MTRNARFGWLLGLALVAAVIVQERRTPAAQRRWHGRIAGVVPYDLRPPTIRRLRQAWWNPGDDRVLTGQPFGIGWSLNLARLARSLRPPSTR